MGEDLVPLFCVLTFEGPSTSCRYLFSSVLFLVSWSGLGNVRAGQWGRLLGNTVLSMQLLHSQTHSSCGCLHKTRTKSWQLKSRRGSGRVCWRPTSSWRAIGSWWRRESCFYLGVWLLAVRPGPGAVLHTCVCTDSSNWTQGSKNKSFKKDTKLGGSSVERALGES